MACGIFIPFPTLSQKKGRPPSRRWQGWVLASILMRLFFPRVSQMWTDSWHLSSSSCYPCLSEDQSSPQEKFQKEEIASGTPRARQEKPVNKWLTHFIDRLEGPQRSLCWWWAWAGEAEETVQDGGGALEGLGNDSLFLRVPREYHRLPTKQTVRGGQTICVDKHRKAGKWLATGRVALNGTRELNKVSSFVLVSRSWVLKSYM